MKLSSLAPANEFSPGISDNAQHSSLNRPYIPALDYLRAVAALTVVLYHGLITFRGYTEPGWKLENWPKFWNPIVVYLVEGHTAVSLFMVLSGYVLTLGVIGRNLSYWRFIINRILRIYPLYMLLLLFGLYIHPSSFSLSSFLQTVLPFANLPGSINSEVLTALFWAVAVEFQFYLLFPFIIYFTKEDGLKYLISLIGLFLLLRVTASFYQIDMNHLFYTSIFGRMDQFLIGVAAAFIGRRQAFSSKLALPVGVVAALGLITLFHRAGGYPQQGWWRMLWHSVEGLAWAGVIVTSVYSPYRMPDLARKILVITADMSFSIYLLHSTVFQIVGERKLFLLPFSSMYMNGMVHALVCLPAILAVSYVTYWVIERPFMQMRVRYVSKD